MLVESVHLGLSARDIGALRGISGERARQLMVYAAYRWAESEKIDLSGKSVPFKNEAKSVKNLYAGLRFFARQQFNELAAQAWTGTRASPVSWSGLSSWDSCTLFSEAEPSKARSSRSWPSTVPLQRSESITRVGTCVLTVEP